MTEAREDYSEQFIALRKSYLGRIANGTGLSTEFLRNVFHGPDVEAYQFLAEKEHIDLIKAGVEEAIIDYPDLTTPNKKF